MMVFCDNYGCMFIDECGFCDCDNLSIAGGVCECSYHSGRNATDSDMCEYCKRVTRPGTVGATYNDGSGNGCELAWFKGDDLPTLQVKSGGDWGCVKVPHCPMCGRDLRKGEGER